MIDQFRRTINYLRISVTDRCNLCCSYCMPNGCPELIPRQQMLCFEEIAAVEQCALSLGVVKIRLTGGEPLLRRGIVKLVEMLGRMDGLEDFGMTTNGILLQQFASQLFEAGLHRLNISLDTLDPERYKLVTGGGDVKDVYMGMQAAIEAGFTEIKVNCVVANSSNEADAVAVSRFANGYGMEARYIRLMDLAKGEYWPVDGGTGGDCPKCNRLRLSCDGKVRPCLFSDIAFDVRNLGAKEAIRQAVLHKPVSGKVCVSHSFSQVGG